MKQRVLFVCIHNSARSQMAEAFLNHTCPNDFEAHSAGMEPGKLNPVVVEAMQEIGIDISGNPTKSVFDMFKTGKMFAYVITVCDEASAERCPIFPGVTKRLQWSFPDPSSVQGTHEEKLAKTREVRDAIKTKIEQWCSQICAAARFFLQINPFNFCKRWQLFRLPNVWPFLNATSLSGCWCAWSWVSPSANYCPASHPR